MVDLKKIYKKIKKKEIIMPSNISLWTTSRKSKMTPNLQKGLWLAAQTPVTHVVI